MEKSTLILLVGPSCSGKDTLLNSVVSAIPSIKKLRLCTTRQPRKGEIDVLFEPAHEFLKIPEKELIDCRSYKMHDDGKEITAYYSNLMPKEILSKRVDIDNYISTHIGITTLDGLKQFDENETINKYFNIKAIYINVGEEIRVTRYIYRILGDKKTISCDALKEIMRRIDADREDFSNKNTNEVVKSLKNISFTAIDGTKKIPVATTDIKHIIFRELNKKETLKAVESILLKVKKDADELCNDKDLDTIPKATYRNLANYTENLISEIVREV